MKTKKYEQQSFVIFACVLILILEIIFVITIYKHKEYKYEKLTATVIKDNLVVLVISSNTKKVLYKNKYLYLNDKKKKYKIIEEKQSVIKKGKKKYYEVLINYKFDKQYKTSDIMFISIKKEKYRIIEIFKLIWDGD